MNTYRLLIVSFLLLAGASFAHHSYVAEFDADSPTTIERNDDSIIFPFECDPDSFFRQLFGEGRMQKYIDRSYRRP